MWLQRYHVRFRSARCIDFDNGDNIAKHDIVRAMNCMRVSDGSTIHNIPLTKIEA